MQMHKIANRVINFLNPYSPVGLIKSATEWIDNLNHDTPLIKTKQPEAWYETLEKPVGRIADFALAKPATEEDYILLGDKWGNGYTLNRGRTIFNFHNARVLGAEGAIISPDNKLFCEFTYIDDGPVEWWRHPVFQRRRIPPVKKLYGTHATITLPLSSYYYHWLIESIPNIRSLQTYLSHIDKICIPRPSKFHLETLAAFGINQDKLIPLDSQSHYQFDRLYVPSFNSGWAPHRWLPTWIKDSMPFLDRSNHKGRRIYISRGDGRWRKVKNEPEVSSFLMSYSFECVELASISFKEQAILFNEADVIIAPHGAGLANMIFCRPQTIILEIFPPRWTPLMFFQLAMVAECNYFFMIADPMGKKPHEILQSERHIPLTYEAQWGDIYVPIEKLKVFLGSTLPAHLHSRGDLIVHRQS
jgi:hypothetical protein